MAGVHLWFCIYGAGLGVHTHGFVISLSFLSYMLCRRSSSESTPLSAQFYRNPSCRT